MYRFLSAASLVLLSLVSSACGSSNASTDGAEHRQDTPPAAAVPVEVVRPRRAEILATYSGTATLEAEADARVIARVAGEVRRILVEEGDAVSEGQMLAVLDGRQLRLEATQARAALAKLEQDYGRQIELHRKGLVAKSAFENLRFDLENLRAAHELAQLQLSYTELRAPFGGIVAERHVKLGANLEPGAVAFRVARPSPLKAQVHIPEREMRRVAPGQAATLQLDALPGRAFPARVTLVSPTVDAATATFKATVEVADGRGELKPGMFARVGIVLERRPDALQIPRAALLDAGGGPSVFVARAGKAVQQPVTVGLSASGSVEILAGLEGGEDVIVVGQSGLKPGNEVRIVSLETPQSG